MLGSQQLTAGGATVLLPKKLKVGRHNLTVTFTPVAGSNVTAPRIATAVQLRVVKAKAKVTLVKAKRAKRNLRDGRSSVKRIRINAPRKAKLKGKVRIQIGKQVVGKARVKKVKGKFIAKVKVKNVRKTGQVRVIYTGDKRFKRNVMKFR
ncbi:hypothetical protein SAMN06309944_0585 [Micrococcales bacterium KH10]|nr:hypothetical protein SAMN06309944_0585 [Micrococcales bacterium KH10]